MEASLVLVCPLSCHAILYLKYITYSLICHFTHTLFPIAFPSLNAENKDNNQYESKAEYGIKINSSLFLTG
jgi:hypothetical protein